jgi:hypothetical protein
MVRAPVRLANWVDLSRQGFDVDATLVFLADTDVCESLQLDIRAGVRLANWVDLSRQRFAVDATLVLLIYGSASASLMRAIGVLREANRLQKSTLPKSAPTGFVRQRWTPHVMPGGEIDRRHYELCALSELRDRLRAGHVWVAGASSPPLSSLNPACVGRAKSIRSCPRAWCRIGVPEQCRLPVQVAKAGMLTIGSSLRGAMVSSVM